MKRFKAIALSLIAAPGLLFTTQEAEASSTCSLTIDANKHTGSNWSYAGGDCEGFIQGIYVPEMNQFNITGMYTANVEYNGQQFQFRIPTLDDDTTLTVNIIQPGTTAPPAPTHEPTSPVSGYKDFKTGYFWSEPFKWSVENRILNGFEDKTLRPYDGMNNAQAALVLMRYAQPAELDQAAGKEWYDAAYTVAKANNLYLPATSVYTPIRRGDFARMMAELYTGKPLTEVEAVQWLYDKGLTKGVNTSKPQEYANYAPDTIMTRGHAVTFLHRADLLNLKPILPVAEAEYSAEDYTDYKTGYFWSNAFEWSVKSGVLRGYPDQTLRPNEKLNQAQAITILMRNAKPSELAQLTEGEWYSGAYQIAEQNNLFIPQGTAYSPMRRGDMARILGEVYSGKKMSEREAVQWLYDKGITVGATTNTSSDYENFAPDTIMNRSHAVTFLHRIVLQNLDSNLPVQ